MCGLFAQRPSTAAKNDEIVPPARSSSWFERHRDLTGVRRRRDPHFGRGPGGGFHHEIGRRGRWAVGHVSVEYFARLRARARPD